MRTASRSCLSLVLLVSFGPAAFGTQIMLATYGTGQDPGNAGNTALAYVGYSASTPITSGVGTGTTYNLTSGISPWAQPLSGSEWVSENRNSTVGLGSAPPNGYYTYTSSFSAMPGAYAGSFGVYADDTAEIFLNGKLVVPFDSNTKNGPCALDGNGPGCIGDPFTMAFVATLGAENLLTIVDWQSNGYAAGVDISGSMESLGATTQSTIPEPSSLLLIVSGLACTAGLLYRKANTA
jgi:hypothetical protein